jgi:hypothetical protein
MLENSWAASVGVHRVAPQHPPDHFNERNPLIPIHQDLQGNGGDLIGELVN